MAVAGPELSSANILREAFEALAAVDIDALDEFEVQTNVFVLRSCIDRLQAVEARFLARWDATAPGRQTALSLLPLV